MVSDALDVSVRAMEGRSRAQRVTRARSAVFGLARTFTDMTAHEIGRRLGNRDHSTVIYGAECFSECVRRGDPKALAMVEAMRSISGNPVSRALALANCAIEIVDADPESDDPAKFPGLRVTYKRENGTRWVGVIPLRKQT